MDNNLKFTVSVWKVILDLGLLIFIGIRPLHNFLITGLVMRGFFCNDESIAYPYIPSQIVNPYYVFAGETVIVSVVILATEFFLHYRNEHKFSIGNLKLPFWIWKIYKAVTAFLFGAACIRMTSYMWKNQVGRLRPHFLDACRPSVNCTDPKNLFIFHENFHCTNPLYDHNENDLEQMRQSFPCGQLATSLYCTLYLTIYLENKMTWQGSTFLKHAIQFAAVNSSMYIGFTNISEYHHFPSDVVAGLFQGIVFALFTLHYIGRLQILSIKSKRIVNIEYQEIPSSEVLVIGGVYTDPTKKEIFPPRLKIPKTKPKN